jgi:hypothetical protein
MVGERRVDEGKGTCVRRCRIRVFTATRKATDGSLDVMNINIDCNHGAKLNYAI